jgi:hypothetical protein
MENDLDSAFFEWFNNNFFIAKWAEINFATSTSEAIAAGFSIAG